MYTNNEFICAHNYGQVALKLVDCQTLGDHVDV